MFFYLNSTINPIIYNVMSEKYRKAFHVTFCRNSIRYLLQKVFSCESDSTIANVCLSVTKKTYLASDIWFIRYRISQISDLSSQSVTKTPLAIHHYLHLHAYCILHISPPYSASQNHQLSSFSHHTYQLSPPFSVS